ncbi:Wzb Protein-tyrosine-phosphatase [Candidatus Nanopelagicaceae bacterium]
MAAAVLANRASELISPKIIVTSSGTSAWHVGESAHHLSEKTWKLAGYSHTHSARQFLEGNFDEVDLILAMDLSNQANILKLARNDGDRSKVAMLRSFDPGADSLEVPDPWGNTVEAYQEVLEMVEAAVTGLLTSLK